jgi:TRAP-type transport system periplasmic protein
MKRALLAAVALLVAGSFGVQAGAAEKFRISLETGPNHVRNISMKKFVEKLQAESAGRLDVEFYEGASLYKDRDVPKALAQGTLEMALPGLWQLDKFVPDAVLIDLPMFFGATAEQVYAVLDGPVGQELNKKLEDKLRVHVIGKYMDLGHVHLYGNFPINGYADIVGKKIRIPGGAASAERFKALGANPVLVPWPDVPLAMTQGTVDGLITTFESVRSAKLWDSNVKYAYADRETFYQYLPMVSKAFWDKTTPEIRKFITDTWAATIDDIRKTAAERQQEAREDAQKAGITVVDPKPADLKAAREKLMAAQDAIIKATGIDPEFVRRAEAALNKAGS